MLFLREHILREAEEALQTLGYALVELDAVAWRDAADLHDALATALHFPDYYGRNFNALDDCLGDVAHGDYGWSPPLSVGLMVVVHGFGDFARRQPKLAGDLAESFVSTTRGGLLFGHQILWLLHVMWMTRISASKSAAATSYPGTVGNGLTRTVGRCRATSFRPAVPSRAGSTALPRLAWGSPVDRKRCPRSAQGQRCRGHGSHVRARD